MSFIGSSEAWGDQAGARLCQIIVEANDGMAQQVQEGKTDLLEFRTLEQLQETDDLGLTLQFLAVYYDRPNILEYLARRGIDLSKPCDPMNYGNPMFYAVNLGKPHLVELLDKLGCRATQPCETVYNKTAEYYAERKDDIELVDKLRKLKEAEVKTAELFRKNYFRFIAVKNLKKCVKAAITIQKRVRGISGRIRWRKVKTGSIALSDEESSYYTSQYEGSTVKSGSVSKSKKKSSLAGTSTNDANSVEDGSIDGTSVDNSLQASSTVGSVARGGDSILTIEINNGKDEASRAGSFASASHAGSFVGSYEGSVIEGGSIAEGSYDETALSGQNDDAESTLAVEDMLEIKGSYDDRSK